MKDDPIIEDARRAGQAYIDSFNGDWKAMIDDLNRRSQDARRTVVSLPPKPIRHRDGVGTASGKLAG